MAKKNRAPGDKGPRKRHAAYSPPPSNSWEAYHLLPESIRKVFEVLHPGKKK